MEDYLCKISYPFQWHLNEQGKDLLSTVCDCHISDDKESKDFRLKIEVEGMLKNDWERNYESTGFDKLLYWIIREELSKHNLPITKNWIEIRATYKEYPSPPCDPKCVDIVPGKPFSINVPDKPIGFRTELGE